MSVNKWLTLISYKCMKKGSSQQQWTPQISTVNLISVTLAPIGSYSSENPQYKNKLKAQPLRLIGLTEKVNYSE